MQIMNRFIDRCLMKLVTALLSISLGLQDLARVLVEIIERRQNRAGLRAGIKSTNADKY